MTPTTDRRSLFANAFIADAALQGLIDAPNFAQPQRHTINASVADLCRQPNGPRDRQFVFGQSADVLDSREGWAFVRTVRDGYVGYVKADVLAPAQTATHRISALASHIYAEADFKSPDLMYLPFGAEITVTGTQGLFFETAHGFVPTQHCCPIETKFDDPAEIAMQFLGVPYLWGGNTSVGIDCSGLVQSACFACAIPCPRDSDQQENSLGPHVPENAPAKRNMAYFWKGHIALAISETELIHANSHAMAVAIEGIDDAVARIEAAGEGPVTARIQL